MSSTEVVISSYGMVSPLGFTPAEFAKKMFSGQSGVRALRDIVVEQDFPVPYAAYILRNELPASQIFSKNGSEDALKSWLMTAWACEQAIAELSSQDTIDAIVYGTADGVSFEQVSALMRNPDKKKLLDGSYDFTKTQCESSIEVISQILIERGFTPPQGSQKICLNSACASGNNAIGVALQGIRSGKWKRCLVGGVDARCEPSNYLNFHYLGALMTAEVAPENASRPFSVDRAGFVRGEGAAILVIESAEAARSRGAKPLAKVSGYGFTSDAYRLTDGREDGASVQMAISLALKSGKILPSEIDYINAHGTSTPLNDRLESLAIKKVFAEHAYRTPISSLKSQIGHSTIASSAIEAIACVLMLNEQKIAPTLNFKPGDPDCDLDYVPNESRNCPLNNVLSNSFGFGGQNACVVFSKV